MIMYDTLSVEEQKTFKNWLGGLLNDGIVRLTFVKKDGTIREMNASTRGDLVAETSGKGKHTSENVVRVTDTDINEWRSVRYDSIKEINFTIGA